MATSPQQIMVDDYIVLLLHAASIEDEKDRHFHMQRLLREFAIQCVTHYTKESFT